MHFNNNIKLSIDNLQLDKKQRKENYKIFYFSGDATSLIGLSSLIAKV